MNKWLSFTFSVVTILALSACGKSGTKVEAPPVVEVQNDSNAILEPIQVLNRGYNNIYIQSRGVDEDGIDHVDFYAIHNGKVASKVSKRYDGAVEFAENINLTWLQDNTVYEVRTVCYSVNGKSKSIEKNSIKTFTKTPNDPSNDTSEVDTQAPVITLNWPSTITLTVWDTYTEQWANVTDNKDVGLTVSISGNVDTSTAWAYTVRYTASDNAGNTTTVIRTVNVVEAVNTAPTITNISYLDNNWNSITQWDIISLSATINDEKINTVTWNVIKDWNVLQTGTGQFTGYDYTIWQTEYWQLNVQLEVTDEEWLQTTVTLINEPIQ